MLDVESRDLLDRILPRYAPSPEMAPSQVRDLAARLARKLQGERLHVAAVEEFEVPSRAGAVPVRIYRPQVAAPGWLLWLHGGGFMTGGLDTHDTLCRRLCALSHQNVVAVDYRVAPENPYPAALEDALAVHDWVRAEGSALRLDPDMLAVGGSSAGGNLAAALTLKLRDAGMSHMRFQLLVYPALDAAMTHSASSPHRTGYQLTSKMMSHYYACYAGPGASDPRDSLMSPFHNGNLDGLPPTCLLLAQLDPLVHEGEIYARKLADAGNAVDSVVYEGVMHGFFGQAGVLEKARTAQRDACNRIRHALTQSQTNST